VDWLKESTEQSQEYWIARVQALIVRHSRKTKDPNHGTTNTRKVLHQLVDDVIDTFPPDERYDGNMRGLFMGMICALWYVRVHRAKCWDPNRPISHRRRAYSRWALFCRELFMAILDERKDGTYFHGQKWESPFVPDAKSGRFV